MDTPTLIEREEHPVVRFGRQLGRDELYAAVLGAAATAAAHQGVEWAVGGEAGVALMAAVLPWVSPLLEKPGLVAHYLWEGVREWRGGGGPLARCLGRSLFDGRAFQTVRADVLFHDPIFIGLMAVGVWLLEPGSAAAAGFLALLSFVGAVIAAAFLEVGVVELGHARLAARLRRRGFVPEAYHEARYLIVPDAPGLTPDAVLEAVAARFGLGDRFSMRYEDWYWAEHGVPGRNGRGANLRLREVESLDGRGRPPRRTLQVVHTRAEEIGRNDASLFRCFAIRKEKFALPVPADAPLHADMAGDGGGLGDRLRELGARGTASPVAFVRRVARDPAGLLVSVDTLAQGGGAFWVEVKVRRDLDLLKAANEFVATRFPVRGTTKGKFTLVADLEEFRGRTDPAPAASA